MVSPNGSAVVIAYNRPNELLASLTAIKESDRSNLNQLIIVLQRGNERVEQICKEIDWIEPTILISDASSGSPMSRINMNVYKGLDYAFSIQENQWVAIIEDDIVIAKDFFRFASYVVSKYREDKEFFGFNGFSGIKRSDASAGDYGKYRYGLGWGWVITKSSWERLGRIWTGEENTHWDVHVEHFVKSGFVIMPMQSRILNIGFNERATNTKKELGEINSQEIRLNNSFVSELYTGDYHEAFRDLEWRNDCRRYLNRPRMLALAINLLYKLNATIQLHIESSVSPSKVGGKIYQIIDYLIRTLYLLAKLGRSS